ncbi:hypothetical protein [Cohnella sp. JJ-181]|uniref:hypothetical protein n=1 Tax=Cohnella rhizoplanae TaxID=2974897 RepID=UPI0022FF92DB|nr:hypothetical protein [Cohnella sp. JJ-181]CAI6075410.1 hypothetical protein COHCIP112018_02472 [Cohnella sp. JJ-181]
MYAFVIEPAGYVAFADESERLEKCKEWDLLSEKATKSKTFYYKGYGLKEACEIVGYVDHMSAVIQFANKQKHCIHHSYLKEMQAANFGQRFASVADPDEAGALPAGAEAGPELESALFSEAAPNPSETARVAASIPAAPPQERTDAVDISEPPADWPPVELPAAAALAKPRASASKSKKVQLPEEKVKVTAVVKEFTTVPNHFADNDDEVIIYDEVVIADSGAELGEAWSSHSATLKKLELAEGDKLSFEAKLVAKKLAKHPIPYKINNPAKIVKEQG